jgi:nitroimidazol reductase NimA-like FMN-containing flavoprotein (pyridoxamine 5'-phosphate oxidase superfamily)
MSSPRGVRRADKLMQDEHVAGLLTQGYSGHLGTVGTDGTPYVCPLLYVWLDGEVWVHNTSARGHLQDNIRHQAKVCFEVDTPGKIFPYGRFQCDTSVEYQSVIVFATARIVEDREHKARFFDHFMTKYYGPDADRPTGFYPRLDEVTVYALAVERMTGKETRLPAPEDRWPARDNTRSPNVTAPPAPAL